MACKEIDIRVALVVPDLVGGGAETLVRHLAAGYRQHGLTVSVMYWRHAGQFAADGQRLARLAGPIAVPGALAVGIRRFDPSVIHAHTPWAGLHAGIERLGTRSRLLYTVHSRPAVKPLRLRVVERVAIAAADAVVCVSGAWQDEVPGGDTRTIPNGTPVQQMYQRQPGDHLLWIGRFNPRKEPLKFVEALQGAPQIRGVFVGDGPLRPRLEALAAQVDNVAVHGWSDEPAQVMLSSAGVVFTSRYEGQPMVALEAMSLGVPLVVPDLTEFRDMLPSDYPFVYSPGDAEQLRERLEHLVSDPAGARAAGEALRALHRKSYSIEVTVDSYVDLLQSL